MRERRGILAGGHWIVDRVKVVDNYPEQDKLATIQEESRGSGGGAYNVLKDLSKMKADFPLEGIGLIGNDPDGEYIRADCEACRIEQSQIHMTDEAPTSYTDVMTVSSTGRRTFFHQPGTNALLDEEHFDFAESRARIFYLGYLMLLERLETPGEQGETGAVRVLRKAKEAGFTTALDLVSVKSERFREIVGPVLPYVDVMILNEYEAECLTGIPASGSDKERKSLAAWARAIMELGVRQMAVIHCPGGALAHDCKGQEFVQGSAKVPESEIRGAAGAGDAFAAGVLYGVHEEWEVQRSLELAVCAAASSLFDTTTSESVLPVENCLELGKRYEYRSLAE